MPKSNKTQDYSTEVYAAMDSCLGCKACVTQCPVHVDIPNLKAKFLQEYHSRYKRPAKDYYLAKLEKMLPLLNWLPSLSNFLLKNKFSQRYFKQAIGLIDLPTLSQPSFKQELKKTNMYYSKKHPSLAKPNTIFILQDAVTHFYQAKLAMTVCQLLKNIGYNVIVLPFKPNGKPLHVKGFLDTFQKTARKNAKFIDKIGQYNHPIIGIDPSITLTYRHEYREYSPLKTTVMLLPEWLSKQTDLLKSTINHSKLNAKKNYYFISHCTGKALAPETFKQWQSIFSSCDLSLEEIRTGCCGMAGSFGLETQHHETSKKLFDMHWQQHMKASSVLLTDGFSCQSQAKRFAQIELKHPVEILTEHILDNIKLPIQGATVVFD